MPECDKTTCDEPAAVLCRFPRGDTRTYCTEHWETLRDHEYLYAEKVRTL